MLGEVTLTLLSEGAALLEDARVQKAHARWVHAQAKVDKLVKKIERHVKKHGSYHKAHVDPPKASPQRRVRKRSSKSPKVRSTGWRSYRRWAPKRSAGAQRKSRFWWKRRAR
jgi:ribosomal protein S10